MGCGNDETRWTSEGRQDSGSGEDSENSPDAVVLNRRAEAEICLAGLWLARRAEGGEQWEKVGWGDIQ